MLKPNERDAWVADAQRWITDLNGVKQCRINLDDQGEIIEVLAVTGMDKPSRLFVRDIETVLKTRLAIDVDYKKISVAQVIDPRPSESSGITHHDTRALFEGDLDSDIAPDTAAYLEAMSQPHEPPATGIIEDVPKAEDQPPEPEAEPEPIPAVILAEELAPRIVCTNVGLMASDLIVRAEVQLRAGQVEALGRVEGPNHADSDLVLVARAAVEAIAQFLIDPVLLHLKEVRLENLGGQDVVLTAVELVEGRRSETLLGSCSTRHNRQQAVVHSVLDALNRRLSLFPLKTAQAEG